MAVSGGDRAEEIVVTGDRLWKHDALVQFGDTIPLPLPIKQSKAYLTKKVFGYDGSDADAENHYSHDNIYVLSIHTIYSSCSKLNVHSI